MSYLLKYGLCGVVCNNAFVIYKFVKRNVFIQG